MAVSSNPFPGPQPYRREDRDRFFGRDHAALELKDSILAFRVLTLFGLSGAGKSSLLQAGVIPRLLEEQSWRVVVVDSWPPEQLFNAGPSARLLEAFHQQLELGEPPAPDLLEAVSRAMRRSFRPLLIVIDQLEQLLENHRVEDILSLVAGLETLAAIRDVKLHLVLSLREDYLGRWTDLLRGHPGLTRSSFRLARLTVREMVLSVVLAAGSGRPPQAWNPIDMLPLIEGMAVPGQLRSDEAEVEAAYVQIVCHALWDQGGLQAAAEQTPARILQHYLASTLSSLGALEPQARVLLEDKLITRTGARIPMTREGALEVVEDGEDLDRILETLESARILRAQQHQGERFFELGHDWLTQTVQQSAQQRREAEARARQQRRRRLLLLAFSAIVFVAVVMTVLAITAYGAKLSADAALADSERARQAEQTAKQNEALATQTADTEAALRKQAEEERQRAEAAEADARQQRDLAEERRKQAQAAEQAARTQAELAASSERRAQAEAGHAQDALLMAAYQTLRDIDPTEAAIFLREVREREAIPGWKQAADAVLQEPLSRAILQEPGRRWLSASFSPDGTEVATVGDDATVWLWKADGSEAPRLLLQSTTYIGALAFSPDGGWVAAAGYDGLVHQVPLRAPGPPVVHRGHQGPVYAVAFSPDGQRLATASEDGTARIWPVRGDGAPVVLRGHLAAVNDVRFSADGKKVVTAARDATARIWPVEGGEALAVLEGHQAQVTSAAFSPDDRRVVTTSRDGTVRVYAVKDLLTGKSMPAPAAAGKVDAGAAAAGQAEKVFAVKDVGLSSAVFSPDGHDVLTAGLDGLARLWAIAGDGDPHRYDGHRGAVAAAVFSADGAWILTGGRDGLAQLWAASSSAAAVPLKGHQQAIASASFSPDGRLALTVSRDGTVRIWPVSEAAGRKPPGGESSGADALAALQRRLEQCTTACALPAQRIQYLAETPTQAEAAWRACEQAQGRGGVE